MSLDYNDKKRKNQSSEEDKSNFGGRESGILKYME